MASEQEIQKKWAIHCAKIEQEHLAKCLSKVIDTIKETSLEKRTKHVLITFYQELKNYFANLSTEELINNAKALQEYSETYIENHNMLLLVGVLNQEKIIPYEVTLAVKALQGIPAQLREKGNRFINALKGVEPYAVTINKRLDEDFYNDEMNSPNKGSEK